MLNPQKVRILNHSVSVCDVFITSVITYSMEESVEGTAAEGKNETDWASPQSCSNNGDYREYIYSCLNNGSYRESLYSCSGNTSYREFLYSC